MPQGESVWKYNLQITQHNESEDPIVKVTLEDYLFMANELGDRITDIADISPDIIVFDEESELLAMLISNSTGSSVLQSITKNEFEEGKIVLFIVNQNTDGNIVKRVKAMQETHTNLCCYTAALFEQRDACLKVDFSIQKTNSAVVFPIELDLKDKNKFGLVAQTISSFMISEKKEPSLDLVSSIERLKE